MTISRDQYASLAFKVGEKRVAELYRTVARLLWDDDSNGFMEWRLSLSDTEQQFVHLACQLLGKEGEV